jgi:hypothetical protein
MTRAVDSSRNDEGGGDPLLKWVIEGRHIQYTLQKIISSNSKSAPFGHMTKHATVADTEVVAVWIARDAAGGENIANEELVLSRAYYCECVDAAQLDSRTGEVE